MYVQVELVAARVAIAQHHSPEQFFRKSEAILRQGLALNPKAFENLGTLASLYLLRAEYYVTLKRPIETEIQNGIQAADGAIAANEQVSEAHVTRGKLYLMKARLLSGPGRIAAAHNAEASLQQAVKVKGTIAKKYAAELEEARRLSQ
jgi:uncharacterized protein (DUF2344 family)